MRYPGGKGKSFQRIINLMPPHRVYIETHLGGGSVIRNKRRSDRDIGLDVDPAVLSEWSSSPVKGVEVFNVDAATFLVSYPFSGDELVYCDPPYLPSTRRRARCYRHEYDECGHARFLLTLLALPCAVMVSGYPSDLYEDLLGGWNRSFMKVSTHVGLREECVWFNFVQPRRLHDYAHVGDNFRARERLRRKIERWSERLASLSALEREAILNALVLRFGAGPNVGAQPGNARVNA